MRRSQFGLPVLFLGFLLSSSSLASSPDASEVLSLAKQVLTNDSSLRVRLAAARLLGFTGDTEAVELLLWGLQKENKQEGMFEDALEGLAACEQPELRTALVEQIAKAKHTRSRSQVASVALRVEPEEALKVAVTVLKDPAYSLDHRLATDIALPAAGVGGTVAIDSLKQAYLRFADGSESGPALAEALRSLDSAVGLQAALEVSRFEKWADRAGAARDLGFYSDPQALERLEELLEEDPERNVRTRAGRSLKALAPKRFAAVAARVARREDQHPRLRRELLVALGELKSTDAIPVFEQALQESDGNVRAGAARGAGLLGLPQFEATLIALLKDESSLVRHQTAMGLKGLRTEAIQNALAEALDTDTDQGVSGAAANSLAAHSDASSRSLLVQRLSKDHSLSVRSRAADALGPDLKATEDLVALLHPKVFQPLRELVVGALAKQVVPQRFPGIFQALKDSSEEVQGAALVALSRDKDWALGASAQIQARLETAPSYSVRLRAMTAMAASKSLRAADALSYRLVSDPHPTVRRYAAQVLRQLSLEHATEAWGMALRNDSDRKVRKEAAKGLALTPQAGFEALRRAVLRDEYPLIRRYALVALEALVR